MDGQTLSLGQKKEITAEPAEFQLSAEDMIFWYTDGILENPSPKGDVIRQRQLIRVLAELHKKNNGRADKIVDELIRITVQFMGGGDVSRYDDVTVVVGTVFPQVNWKRSLESR